MLVAMSMCGDQVHFLVTLPIINERERQTYYGAINPVDGEVTAILADAGNGYWTCIFVEYLREQYAGK